MKIKSFDELNIKTPEEREEEFLKLVLKSGGTIEKLVFTQTFDYDLNPNNTSLQMVCYQYVKIKAQILLQAICNFTPEQHEKYKDSLAHPQFELFLKETFLASLDEDKALKEFEEFLKRYHKGSNGKEKNVELSAAKVFKHYIGYNTKDGVDCDFNFLVHEWLYFRSKTDGMFYNKGTEIEKNGVNHRLYIAINCDQMMNLVKDFIFKLEAEKIPYCFKIKTPYEKKSPDENDTVVIYADNEQRIVDYVNILNEIIEKNEKYQQAIHGPSAHIGLVNQYIGYAREISKYDSYSSVIGKCALTARRRALQEFQNSNYFKNREMANLQKEMLKIIEEKDKGSRAQQLEYNGFYNMFKETFWKELYEELDKKGFPVYGDSICLNVPETSVDKNL